MTEDKVIKAVKVEKVVHPDGREDVTVFVPRIEVKKKLMLSGKTEKQAEEILKKIVKEKE